VRAIVFAGADVVVLATRTQNAVSLVVLHNIRGGEEP
jgi:hypothetical protein